MMLTRGTAFIVPDEPTTQEAWVEWLPERLSSHLWCNVVEHLMSHPFAGAEQQRLILDACNTKERHALLENALELAESEALYGFTPCSASVQAWQHDQLSVPDEISPY